MNKLIMDTLKPLGVPVGFQTYKGTATTYITFTILDESPALNADDDEIKTSFLVQVDVWSNGDYTDLVNQVKNAMKNAGFKRTSAYDLYENDTNTYHKALRFSYSTDTN